MTGVDFSEVGLEKAGALARACGARAEWVTADVLGYTPERQAFNLALVFYLQVTAAQRRPIVRAAAGAVAPGGVFLLVARDRRNLEHGHGGPPDPAVLYTAGDVVGDLEGAGFEIERAETVHATGPDAHSDCYHRPSRRTPTAARQPSLPAGHSSSHTRTRGRAARCRSATGEQQPAELHGGLLPAFQTASLGCSDPVTEGS